MRGSIFGLIFQAGICLTNLCFQKAREPQDAWRRLRCVFKPAPTCKYSIQEKVPMPCKLTSDPSAPKIEKLSRTVCPTRVAYMFWKMMASFRKGVQCVLHAVARSSPKSQDRVSPEKQSKNHYRQKGPLQCVLHVLSVFEDDGFLSEGCTSALIKFVPLYHPSPCPTTAFCRKP